MIVMKFGGTSVKDAAAIDRAAGIVQSRLARRPVVVVSAMSKVTDALIATGKHAGSGELDRALELSRQLRDRHYTVTSEVLGIGTFTALHEELQYTFDTLDELLRGIAAVGEITPRTADMVVSYGERLNSKICAAAFAARGMDALQVDARQIMITDSQHGKAVPRTDEIDQRAREHLQPLLDAGKVPVLGGFIGSSQSGAATTIGRGGSDFSAELFGAALDAEAIEIWTDVDGMMTTDPNLCSDAHRIRVISFEEAAELAYFGARVLHPATVLPAVRKNIPVYVLNSGNPKCEGTRIVARAPKTNATIKAIAAKQRITIVDVVAARMLGESGFLKAIFDVFDRHKAAVDVVSTSEVSVSLTVDSNEAIPAVAADLEKIADVKYEGRKAIVCLVGENIRYRPGIAAQVFSAIRDINVRMISQGASEINLTFVVDESDVPETVRRLHKHFFANPDPEVFD